MKKTAVLLGFLVGVACSNRDLPDVEDPAYQRRIDAVCTATCAVQVDCDPARVYTEVPPCFEECSKADYWRVGDDDCKEARFEASECIGAITSCDVWLSAGAPEGQCGEKWNASVVACHPWANEKG